MKKLADELYKKTYAEFLLGKEPFSVILERNLATFSEKAKREILENVYKRISDKISEPIKTVTIRNIHLSRRIYNNIKKVEKQVLYILREHEKRKSAIDTIERVLFDGYDPDRGEYLEIKHSLPKYLFGDIEKAKMLASKTKFLKEAYLQYLNSKNDNELEKNLYVALAEKGRFYAQRIANTEEQRAFSLTNANDLLNDDEVQLVKYTMSSKHPMVDICDYYANLDIGYGKGIVPKEKMIILPLHPFCLCKYEPVYKKIKKRDIKDPHGKTLYSFPEKDRIRILGSKEKYEEFRNGKPILEIFNESRPKYPVFYVKDQLEKPVLVIEEYYKPDLEPQIKKIVEKAKDYFEKLKPKIRLESPKKPKAKKNTEYEITEYSHDKAEELLGVETVTNVDIDAIIDEILFDILENKGLPKEWLLTKLDIKDEKLLARIKRAVKDYTGDAYTNIRKLLTDDPQKLMNDFKLYQTESIAKHLSILHATEGNIRNRRVFRGLKIQGKENKDWAKKLLELKPGDYYFDKSFASYSTSENVAMEFANFFDGLILEFKIKEPKHNIEKMSKYRDEKEVLIDAYQPFRVRGIFKDMYGNRRIVMEEIPLKPIKEKISKKIDKADK